MRGARLGWPSSWLTPSTAAGASPPVRSTGSCGAWGSPQRLAALEVHSARAAGLLTERTRGQLLAAQRRRGPHVAAQLPGELLCLDTFYIGKLKGVGKDWQYTACDAASSEPIAQVSTAFSADAGARFLTTRALPAYRAAGWRVQRVLTEQGNEYRGAFDRACHALRIRHTRTQPRHAWTNGFVERLQGTILSELWCIEFRRRFFIGVAAMQGALDRFLGSYNHQRPHLGYRTRGRPPRSSGPRNGVITMPTSHPDVCTPVETGHTMLSDSWAN